jgi:hypothetical protein
MRVLRGECKMSEEILNIASPMVEQKESVKLFRNSKGYTWEIRLIEIDLDRLEKIDNDMKTRFRNEAV